MGEIASKSFLFCSGQIHVSARFTSIKQFQLLKVNRQGKNAKRTGTYFLLSTGYGTHLVLLIQYIRFASNCCSDCILALPQNVVEKHTPNTHY